MMKKIHIIILYMLIVALIGYMLYNGRQKTTTVYVDNLELFSGFKMKVELEKKYKQIESARKTTLDSLYNQVRDKINLNEQNEESISLLKRDFLAKKETIEKENAQTMSSFNEQIWTQLNEYTKLFGEEQHYDFILGANGQGVLMYAADSKNVTKELLNYVNKKYDGK